MKVIQKKLKQKTRKTVLFPWEEGWGIVKAPAPAETPLRLLRFSLCEAGEKRFCLWLLSASS